MVSISNDNSLLSDQNTNRFLILIQSSYILPFELTRSTIFCFNLLFIMSYYKFRYIIQISFNNLFLMDLFLLGVYIIRICLFNDKIIK